MPIPLAVYAGASVASGVGGFLKGQRAKHYQKKAGRARRELNQQVEANNTIMADDARRQAIRDSRVNAAQASVNASLSGASGGSVALTASRDQSAGTRSAIGQNLSTTRNISAQQQRIADLEQKANDRRSQARSLMTFARAAGSMAGPEGFSNLGSAVKSGATKALGAVKSGYTRLGAAVNTQRAFGQDQADMSFLNNSRLS